jgi:hypothetical protein
MNLEQIVKETVAKIVAEKELTAAEEKKREEIVKAMKKDFKGPEGAMYAIATKNAKKLAEDGDMGGLKTYGMKKKSFFGNDTENGPDPADSNPPTPIDPELEKLYDKKEIIDNQWDYQRRQYTQAIKNNDNPAVRQQIEKEWERINSKFKQKSQAIEKQIDMAWKNKKLAEDEDHEVSMAQRSLDSILRSAMELKAKIGNQEINIPAWIQDHITNSENFIDQASQGYHEYENGSEHSEMDEAFIPKSSFDDFKIGDPAMLNGQKVKITAMKMDDVSGERRARIRFEDDSVDDVNINSLDILKESNDDKIEKYKKYTYTLDGEVVKPEITFLNNILKAMLGNKIYNIGAPENGKVELSPESGKKGTYTESTELDEWTIRRMQHYAGIK